MSRGPEDLDRTSTWPGGVMPDRGREEPEGKAGGVATTLPEILAARLGKNTVVVGIGNPQRGDDAAGCLVARLLGEVQSARRTPGLRVVDAEEVPESFLGNVVRPKPDTVVFLDAVELGEPPGTVALLEVEELEARDASTHRPPLSLLAYYIRAETGADVFMIGIQPGAREVGIPPGLEVLEAARIVAHVLEAATC